MIYKDLDAIDSTSDQDLGLTIAFKLAVSQQQSTAKTPGAYLAERVVQLLADYAAQHVGGTQNDRILTAFAKADAKTRDAAAVTLGVDLAIDPEAV